MRTHNWIVALGSILGLLAGGCVTAFGAELKAVSPPGAEIVGPYTPGILAGDLLYVSGQGARDKNGKFPPTTAEQVKQTLDNIKLVVEAAGLTMEHVVYSQMYLTDAATYEEALGAWRAYFPDGGPARAVLGMARMPGTPVEINAVAVTDLALKRPIRLAGQRPDETPPDAVVAGDKLYLSSCYGLDAQGKMPAQGAAQAKLALDRMGAVLKAAGLGFDHVVFVNPYLTDGVRYPEMNKVYARRFKFGDTPARATIRVSHLPHGAAIAFTGVATMKLSSRRAVRPINMPPSPTASPCVFAGDTLYCSAKSAFIPGPNLGIYASSVENQVRQTMRNLLDGLEKAGLDLTHVVASNVYLDDMDEFAGMNRTYAQYFQRPYPTRTTVQPLPPSERKRNKDEQWPMLEQISVVAVK